MVATEVSVQELVERLARLEAANAQKDADIAALREQADAQANGDYLDSLQKAMAEFRKDNEKDLGGVQSGPCVQCGKTWRNEHGEIRNEHNPQTGHSFRSWNLNSVPSEPGTYSNDKRPVSKVEKPQDVYLTTHDAGQLLGVSAKKVTTLIAQGVLKADKYGTVTLVHTESVNRILAEIEVANASA